MTTYVAAFLLSLLVSWFLNPRVRDFAIARGWMDSVSDPRKIHLRPIPRLGGVAIAAGFFVPVLGLFAIDNRASQAWLADETRTVGLMVGAAMMVVLGAIDDVRGLNAWQKLPVQIAAAVLAWWVGFRFDVIANPFGDPIALGALSLPVTLLWIVGITNAMNLIDGLDGLAGGAALSTVLILFVLAVVRTNVVVGLTSIALAGALLGFLRYNFNPASIFMGDSGSLFLGYVLSVTAIWGSAKSSTLTSMLIPVLSLGLPVFDTSMAVFRRFLKGKPILSADREHVHHRLLDLGLSQRQAVLMLYGFCTITGLMALGMVYANGRQTAVILITFLIAAVIVARLLGYLDWVELSRSVRYGLRRGRGTLTRVAAARTLGMEIRAATRAEDAMDLLLGSTGPLEVDQVKVNLRIRGPATDESLVGTSGNTVEGLLHLEYPVSWSRGPWSVEGKISFGWNCKELHLQVPEEPLLDWLAMLLRDRLLELASAERQPAREAPGAEPLN